MKRKFLGFTLVLIIILFLSPALVLAQPAPEPLLRLLEDLGYKIEQLK